MNAPTPLLNLPGRHQRKFVKHGEPTLGGVALPFYFVREVVLEGSPIVLAASEADLAKLAQPGQTHGAKVVGLSFIETYDASQLGIHSGFYETGNSHLPIQTASGIRNPPITVIGGAGYGSTVNYVGTVAHGDRVAIASGGKLKSGTGAPAGDLLPAWFEGSGVDGNNMIRIRFDFPRDVTPV